MALSQAEVERACCERIQQYLFDKVWNEPQSEYASNIKPMLVCPESRVGSFSVLDANITLPTKNDAYYIWAMSLEDFYMALQLPKRQWVDTATICNEYNTLVHCYGANGVMFHKGSVYLRYNQSRKVIYICAKKDVVKRCIPLPRALNEIYLTVYYDSDRTNSTRIHSSYYTRASQEQTYYQEVEALLATADNVCQIQVYRNGIEVTPGNGATPRFETNTYLDVIVDKNIVFTYDVDLTSTSENPVYLSQENETWKQIIHTPKVLNPQNCILTHNTCDFFVRRKRSDGVYGHYLHRNAEERSVCQITHQDFGIPLFVLDAYRDYLAMQDITIHVAVRIHDKDNVLIRDASYIDLLYCDYHNDEQIIDILRGKGPDNIPWWRAAALEQCKYVEMMFDAPNYAAVESMQDYVDALGFYHVMSLLCRRILRATVTDAWTGKLTFSLPLLFNGYTTVPVVYLNGKQIRRRYVSAVTNADGTLTVSFDENLVLSIGDQLVFVLYATGNSNIYEFKPNSRQLSIEVPYKDPIVYLKKVRENPLRGINRQSSYVYEKQFLGKNVYALQETETGSKITFRAGFADETFLIENPKCSYYRTYDLTEYTRDGKNLAIPVEAVLSGTLEYRPIFDISNIAVYMNGSYLVQGIDFFLNQVEDEDGNPSFYELVIQTMDHFVEGGVDEVDVLFNITEIEDTSNGFVINDILQDATPVNLYFPDVTTVHVDGKLREDLNYKGIYIELPAGTSHQGDIFEVETCIPKAVKDFINHYSTNEDYHRIEVLNQYFYKAVRNNVDFLLLEGKHRLYSTFMTAFLHDAHTGELPLVLDPDVVRLAQQIKPYLYLRQMDLCYAGLDQRFVDYYPQYINYAVKPIEKLVLDKVIQLYMPENTDPHFEVVY